MMMRAVPFVVVMLLTGCSFAGAGPVPSVSAVNVSQPASPSAAPVEVMRLKSQESVRGAEVLVPAGWSMDGTDGGGSGSTSTWTGPLDSIHWITAEDGMELGAWLETDGVTGSVDPAGMMPEGAEVVRESRTVFRYSYSDPSTGLIVRGAWIVGVDEASGQADGYERVEVSLPVDQDSVVEEILDAFIEQAKARFAGGGSPSPRRTMVTLNVSGCDGCVFTPYSVQYDPDGEMYTDWKGEPVTVEGGFAQFVIPTRYTEGMSIQVDAPWESENGAVPMVTLSPDSWCWTGTSDDKAMLDIITQRLESDDPRYPPWVVPNAYLSSLPEPENPPAHQDHPHCEVAR